MKILFLVHAHPALQAGGTEIFSRDLFQALRHQGLEGMLLAGSAGHQRPPNPGTPFQAIDGESDEALLWTGGFDPFFMSQTDLHGVGPAFAALLRDLRPDIVHIHHLMVLGTEIVGVVRRCLPAAKIVMTLHDFYPICANDGQMVTTAGKLCRSMSQDACRRCFPERTATDFRLRRLAIDRAFSLVDHFIAPSHFLRERFAEWGLSRERIDVIPNGLPVVSPTPARPADRRQNFAFFGHINRFKGATVALDASAMLSALGVSHQLTLYGGTDHQTDSVIQNFEQALNRAPDAIYRGRYDRRDLPRLMKDVDWVVFPSEWWENAPLVINEAFQHWRPVLASDIGGGAELVTDEVNGLHFPVGNAKGLMSVMRRAIEQPGLWQSLVDGISPPPTIEQCCEGHLALYAQLLGSAERRAA